MLHALIERKLLRRILLSAALAILLLVSWRQLPRVLSVETFSVDDFVEYWAAGRLNLTGGNPYSPEELLPLQRVAGLDRQDAVMMWNPPWTLALVMPFGLLSYPIGRLLWLLLNLALLVASATYIWWYYAGPRKQRWVALLVLGTYVPALSVLRNGQIATLMLVGILGFLHFEERRHWIVAGAFAGLVAIKPHLIYLFWIALVLWVVERRAWAVLLGTLAALVLGIAVAWWVNPDAISQYITAATNYPPRDWATTTIGGGLRFAFGYEHFWLQYLPPLAGTLWFLWYWSRERLAWRWADQMPLLLMVSLVSAPYGWAYDQVVLLLPILQVATWVAVVPWGPASTLLVIGYVGLNGLALAMTLAHISLFWFLWLAPAFLLWYLLARHRVGRDRVALPGGDAVLRPAGHEAHGRL